MDRGRVFMPRVNALGERQVFPTRNWDLLVGKH